MKYFLYINLVLVLIIGLNGCGDSMPSCSDNAVKDLVAELSKEKILPHVAIKEKDGKKLTYQQSMSALYLLSQNGVTMDIKKNATEEEKQLWDNILKAQKIAKEKLVDSIRVTGIRTNKKDETAKKVECSAEIEHPDIRSYSVDYSAQYTDDNQVVVELY